MPAQFGSHKRRRRSIRLKDYDYTRPGAYFVTICTRGRECLFGELVAGEMILSPLGCIAYDCWRLIPDHFPTVELGAFVVMPNHIHGIIFLNDDGRGTIYRAPATEQFQKPVPGSIPTIVRTYKAAVSRRCCREHDLANVWQRNYYEYIIRDDAEWRKIHEYILTNPARWEEDRENTAFGRP